MTRWVLACALASGCIYAEPINQRPALDIERVGGGEIYRGDRVDLDAIASDPEGQLVFFQWRGYACTDSTPDASGGRPGCDAVPFYTEILEHAKFYVPTMRADLDVPVEQVLVLLEGKDDFGATAKPIQQLELAIANHAPDVALRADPVHGKVVNTTINLYAEIGDLDDGFEATLVEWQVYTPMSQPTYDFTDLAVPADPMDPKHLQLGKRFKPHGIGDWEIEVRATDVLGKQTIERLMIPVVDDHAPCLAQWAPLATLAPPLPLTERTLFQVHVVQDDLDPFPAVPGDAELGVSTFSWSILPPGASARQALTGVTTNGVELDPANYTPGDVVELRVEIADRISRTLPCADGSQICSVTGDACIQRQTWRVEVR